VSLRLVTGLEDDPLGREPRRLLPKEAQLELRAGEADGFARGEELEFGLGRLAHAKAHPLPMEVIDAWFRRGSQYLRDRLGVPSVGEWVRFGSGSRLTL
jgi:hypothetical protein